MNKSEILQKGLTGQAVFIIIISNPISHMS